MPIYVFSNASHTTGHLFQDYLINHDDVYFTGYDTTHPLQSELKLSIETFENNSSSVFDSCRLQILDDLNNLKNQLT